STDRYQLEALGFDLYSGTGGIAVFLAAAARLLGRPEFGHMAREALAPLDSLLDSHRFPQTATSAMHMDPGAGCGIGSLVYSLTRSACLLGDEELLGDAHRAAAL